MIYTLDKNPRKVEKTSCFDFGKKWCQNISWKRDSEGEYPIHFTVHLNPNISDPNVSYKNQLNTVCTNTMNIYLTANCRNECHIKLVLSSHFLQFLILAITKSRLYQIDFVCGTIHYCGLSL